MMEENENVIKIKRALIRFKKKHTQPIVWKGRNVLNIF